MTQRTPKNVETLHVLLFLTITPERENSSLLIQGIHINLKNTILGKPCSPPLFLIFLHSEVFSVAQHIYH